MLPSTRRAPSRQKTVSAHRSSPRHDLLASLTPYELDLRRYIHERIQHDVADNVHTEDVLQEVRIAVYLHSISDSAPPRAFLPWAREIARFKLADRTRDARNLKRGGQIDHTSGRRQRKPAPPAALLRAVCPRRTPEQEALHHETLARLRAARARLTPAQQRVIALRYDEGLPYADIAQRLHHSPRSVERLLYEALRALRRFLAGAQLARDPKLPSFSGRGKISASARRRKP
jgi:RNA polymerase sigma factor (sigma-70 family)